MIKKISNNIYLIREATFEIENDIDFILKEFIQFRNNIVNRKLDKEIGRSYSKREDVFVFKTDSSKFSLDFLKEAHRVNPIEIHIGILNTYPRYASQEGKVVLGYNNVPLNFMFQGDFDFKRATRLTLLANPNLDESFYYHFYERMFDVPEIENQIVHELSHWLRDTFSDRRLFSDIFKGVEDREIKRIGILKHLDSKSNISKGEEEKKRQIDKLSKSIQNILFQNEDNASLSAYEIDAQMHEIKMIYKKTERDVWDMYSFDEIFNRSLHLKEIALSLEKQKEVYKRWLHLLFVRMLREGILPRQLKDNFREQSYFLYSNFLSIKELKESDREALGRGLQKAARKDLYERGLIYIHQDNIDF